MSRAEQQSKFARRARRPRLVPVAIGLGVALAVAGCGASQTSQTATQVAAVNGAQGDAGTMLVRDAQLKFPPSGTKYQSGSAAQLTLTIVNGGNTPDELVKVSSPNAASAQLGGQTTIPARFAVSANNAGESSSSSSAGAQPGGSQIGTITVTLQGLTQDITPGQKIAVTFLFRSAGPVTLQLPIGAPSTSAG